MFKKIFIIVFGMALAMNASSFFGDDEKDKKAKRGNTEELSEGEEESDTSRIEDRQKQADDTLVFEDWDQPDGNSKGEAPNIIAGANSPLGGGDQPAYSAGEIVDALRGYNDHKYEVNFTLYPNPAISTLNIAFDNTPDVVRIYSITGTLMFEEAGVESVDVSGFTPGTYIVQLVYHDHVETAKFIKGS